MVRKQFDSSWVFVLAAVGSAAGLGNLWRFPYLVFTYGGGAFLIAYLVCLFFIGMTLLIVETGLGQLTELAAPSALAQVTHTGRLRFIGWLAILVTFVITTYYTVITSWALNYAVDAYRLPWQQHASDYFYHQFLHVSASINAPSHLVWPIVIGTFAIYTVLFLSIRRGTQGISLVARWITPVPIIMIVALAINSITLPGAALGIKNFVTPNWSYLLHDDVWFAAASQVFFTLSIGFGVMVAYGALLKKSFSVRKTALTVIIGDSVVALFCGVVVYSVLGYLSYVNHIPIAQVIKPGIGLAFIVIPRALSLLPLWPGLFSVLFYVALVGLAFTSIVSLGEAVVAAIQDAQSAIKRPLILLVFCVIAFLVGLIFMRTNGIMILDIVDHYVSGLLLLLVGLLEVLAVGWLYDVRRLRLELQICSPARVGVLFVVFVRYFIPLLIMLLLIKELYDTATTRYGGYPLSDQLLYGVGPVAAVVIVVVAFYWWMPMRQSVPS